MTSLELLASAGRHVGGVVAGIVNFFNPSLIVIGGGGARAGDGLLATIRETVYRRSLPLSTRNLVVHRSQLGWKAGVVGAATMVANELFAPDYLALWLDAGTPVGQAPPPASSSERRGATGRSGARARRTRRRTAARTRSAPTTAARVSTGGSAPRSTSSSAVRTLTAFASATAATVEPGPTRVAAVHRASASPAGVHRSSTTSAWSSRRVPEECCEARPASARPT